MKLYSVIGKYFFFFYIFHIFFKEIWSYVISLSFFCFLFSSGIERPIPEKVLKRLDIAYDKLNLHNYERKLIKPFTVYGFDVFQAGI